jgi:hypothetical protein
MADEPMLDVANGTVEKATDPVVTQAYVVTPADFAAQFPNPLDTTELLAMCDEISVWKAIPEERTLLKTYTWREMTSLAFASGTNYETFADGECPEEYKHNGSNKSVDLKNIGAKKSLTVSDILHSMGSIQAGYGISALGGPFGGSVGMPGGSPSVSMPGVEAIASLKAKEMKLASVLVMNAWDTLLVTGDVDGNALEFDGIEYAVTAAAGAHSNTNVSGTFSAAEFDRWLSEGCAKPTHLFGHPQAIQELLSSYFQLGFAGSQSITMGSGDKVRPGFNFAGEVLTGVGLLICVSDINFSRTAIGSTLDTNIYALRMSHNGEPLVYKITQIPLSFQDLTPGCTSISFQIWTKTALVIKAMCAQGLYRTRITGNIVTTCPRIG